MKRLLALLLCVVMVVGLAACSQEAEPANESPSPAPAETPVEAEEETPAALYTPGTYTGTGGGNNGDITVEVTLTENEITGIQVTSQHETYYMFSYVDDEIPSAILEGQTLAVDTVAGATNSSRGLIAAVSNALEQAGADLDRLTQAPAGEEQEVQTLSADAVVVGAGFAGLSAANRLQQNGVDVLLIEQLDVIGGSARFSGGSFMAATSEETAQQMKDFIETRLYYGDFPVPEGAPDLERIYANVDATQNAYNMFMDLGIELVPAGTSDEEYVWNATVPDYYQEAVENSNANTAGAWLVERVANAYLEQGGELMTHVKATSLITDGAGAVTGVNAEGRDCDYVIEADAVILATGSYTHNEELLEEYLPERAGDYFCTTVGADGSGIQMALDVGAVMTEDNYLNGGARLADPLMGFRTVNGAYSYSDANSTLAMIVGRDGSRLASEVDDRYFRYYSYEDGLDQFYCIYDTAQLESAGLLESFEEKVTDGGPYFKADTLEELAALCGFDEEAFLTSVEQFNNYCETGEDVFELSETSASHTNIDQVGKTGTSSASDEKLPLAQGPFYATRLTFVGFDIIGGLKTGPQGQVLRADGSAIDGLYAIGFTSSRNYMGSGASHYYCLMLCLSSGMITADEVTVRSGLTAAE